MEKSEEKRPLGGQRHRWVERWIWKRCDGGCMDWIGLAQYRHKWGALVNVVMNLWGP
jgi:hypothetical protein